MAIRNANVAIEVGASQAGSIGIATPAYTPKIAINDVFDNGNDAELKLDIVGSALLTMTGSEVTLDLRGGGLVDANNEAVNPAEGDVIAVQMPAENVGDVDVDTTLTNGWTDAFDGTFHLPPKGYAVIGCVTGWVITAGTGDLIGFTGASGDKAKVLLLGRSVPLA